MYEWLLPSQIRFWAIFLHLAASVNSKSKNKIMIATFITTGNTRPGASVSFLPVGQLLPHAVIQFHFASVWTKLGKPDVRSTKKLKLRYHVDTFISNMAVTRYYLGEKDKMSVGSDK